MVIRLNGARLGLMLGLLIAGPAPALELNIHGALAQGYALSEGNDYIGNSTSGSRDLYEVAINGRTVLTPQLLVSGQLTARRFGKLDDARLRVDFAQLDWQFHSAAESDAGLRIGKVKNAYGLHNDSRDVVFARPGILLPASVYFEGLGFRDLFFSVEGVQLYAHRSHGGNLSEFTVSTARDFDASDSFERSLTSGSSLEGRAEVSDYYLGQWLQDWGGGRFRSGLSYFGAGLQFIPDDPQAAFATLTLDSDLYVLSLQYLGPRNSLTFEYRYSVFEFRSQFGTNRGSSDGGYLQFRRLVSPELDWFVRYDVTFSDRSDRDGRESEANSGRPRWEEFSRNHTVGLQWRPAPSWGVFAEHHYIDGTANLPITARQSGQQPERHWQVTLLMLAYRF